MDPIRAYTHEVYMLRSRDKQWSTALDMLEDQNRYLQWHIQLEKAERMKQEAEVVMMRRELGPDRVAALRNRLKAPSVKVYILFSSSRQDGDLLDVYILSLFPCPLLPSPRLTSAFARVWFRLSWDPRVIADFIVGSIILQPILLRPDQVCHFFPAYQRFD